MTVLPALTVADQCPICGQNHMAIDEFWACPRHGHQLQYDHATEDGYAIYTCPGHKCRYQRAAPRPRKGHALTITEPNSATLAIRDGQDFWDAKQIAALGQLGIRDASNADLAVYLHYCQKTGLDPFSRQIYMIGRRTRAPGGEWEMRQTIQIGIDGYRIIASRAARRDGVAISYGETLWYDSDGRAYPVWTRPDPPAAAAVTVYRGKDAFPGVARFASFAPHKDGKPTGQWATMPDHMVAKCAEAQALRRAFPHDLAGTQTTDETAREHTVAWAEQVITEPPAIAPAHASPTQRSQIGKLFAGMGFEEHEQDEVHNILAKFTGADEPVTPDQLNHDQAAVVIGHLKACNGSRPALMELLTEATDD
jgi:phage recombination protein Bet